MTQEEYKKISKALEKLTENFIKSVDSFNNEIKKQVGENIKQIKKVK